MDDMQRWTAGTNSALRLSGTVARRTPKCRANALVTVNLSFYFDMMPVLIPYRVVLGQVLTHSAMLPVPAPARYSTIIHAR